MSYRFTMNFKKVNSELEAMQIINKISKLLLVKENFEKLVNDNYLFFKHELLQLDINIKNIDKLKYYGEQDFGIEFDKSIYFQNSTDQDYPYEEFEGLCDKIDKEIQIAKRMEAEELDIYLECHDIEYIKEDVDYYRRTYVYDYVYRLLNLNYWLYKKDFEKQNMFAFNMSIPVAYNHFELYKWFIEIMKNKELVKNE